jgi:hypothetical protein
MRRAFACVLAFTILVALPAAAAPVRSIGNGIDVWHTPGDGTTFVSFDKNPIPKGFFCAKSAAFTGRIVLKGRPLVTANPGELGGADTIVQRLDDAVFDPSGVATTRVQLRALQLESAAPIKTSCGDFHVRVSLNGTQPTTQMKIIRETATSGRFVAPLKVQYKVTFFPAEGVSAQRLELVRGFTLAPATNATWGVVQTSKALSRQANLLVDTDSDQVPDTYLPRTSGNFQAGWTPAWEKQRQSSAQQKLRQEYAYDCALIVDPECHPEAEGIHCAMPCGYAY